MPLINFRVDEKTKTESKKILDELGVTPSELFTSILRYVIENKRLPVEIKVVDNLKTTLPLITDNEIFQKLSECKNSYIYAPTGTGVFTVLLGVLNNIMLNGDGCILSDHILSNQLSEKWLETLVKGRGKEPFFLDFNRNLQVKNKYGFNPLLNVPIERVAVIFANMIASKSNQNEDYEVLKNVVHILEIKNTDSLNLKFITEQLQINKSQIIENKLISDDRFTFYLNKLETLNKSFFSDLLNNLDESNNINLIDILENNRFLLIKHDPLDESIELSYLKELVSNELNLSSSLIERHKERNSNFFLCSNGSIFSKKSLFDITERGRKDNHFLIMHNTNMGEWQFYISARCQNKLILRQQPILYSGNELQDLKEYFGSKLANLINSEESKYGIFIDQDYQHYCY